MTQYTQEQLHMIVNLGNLTRPIWLLGADLSQADLRDAPLQGANLKEANLQNANLQGANLRGVNLIGADLTGADLKGADLKDVLYDGNTTKWPRNFDAKKAGAVKA